MKKTIPILILFIISILSGCASVNRTVKPDSVSQNIQKEPSPQAMYRYIDGVILI